MPQFEFEAIDTPRAVPVSRVMVSEKQDSGMIYQVHILKRFGTAPARLIEKRTHTARSDMEAIELVKKNFSISSPTASGFSLCQIASKRDPLSRPIPTPRGVTNLGG